MEQNIDWWEQDSIHINCTDDNVQNLQYIPHEFFLEHKQEIHQPGLQQRLPRTQ